MTTNSYLSATMTTIFYLSPKVDDHDFLSIPDAVFLPLYRLVIMFIHPANPPGADQAVFAHTMMAPASSWEEEA
jgi:hypothetical protein